MDTDDATLMAALGELIRRVDPVPADVTLAARSALAWRRMDAELAELLEDSATETELAGTRGGESGWRALTFESPNGITIEVEITLDGTDRIVLGQIIPACPARVGLRFAKTQLVAEADDLGRFRFDRVPSGPVSLRIEHSTCPVETGWVTI